MKNIKIAGKYKEMSYEDTVKDVIKDGGPPSAAIVLCSIKKRGGSVSGELSEHDFNLWCEKHGDPAWGRIASWAKQLDEEREVRDGKRRSGKG
jgi:hypothetical protein